MTLLPTVANDAAYQALRPRDDLWLAAATAIADRHRLPAPTGRFARGTMPVLALGERHVVKLFPPIYDDSLAAERDCLARVEGRLGVATAALRADDDLDGWGYLVMDQLPGITLEEARERMPEGERQRVAAELGEAIARLHALPVAPPAVPWAKFLDTQTKGCVARQRLMKLDEPWLAQLPAWLSEHRPLLGATPTPALLHTELGPGHVLCDEIAGRWRVTGIIDWADARIGDPEYELPAVGVFVARGEPAMLDAFLSAYGLAPAARDQAFRQRLLTLALLHRYSSLAWYLTETPPAAEVTTLAALADAWFS